MQSGNFDQLRFNSSLEPRQSAGIISSCPESRSCAGTEEHRQQ